MAFKSSAATDVVCKLEPISNGHLRTPPLEISPYPGALRCSPRPVGDAPRDFIDGLFTMCGNGSPKTQSGMVVHLYGANKSMVDRAFSDADGELLILPQEGGIRIMTELGIIDLEPGEVSLIPEGMKLRVELKGTYSRGFVRENFGHRFVLPELGLIGSHGLANAVDFLTPVAAYEEGGGTFQIVHKYGGQLWACTIDHSPLDGVAWCGNWAPSKHDMRLFVSRVRRPLIIPIPPSSPRSRRRRRPATLPAETLISWSGRRAGSSQRTR
jgi:homogentisate 1,2-dioxygenase